LKYAAKVAGLHRAGFSKELAVQAGAQRCNSERRGDRTDLDEDFNRAEGDAGSRRPEMRQGTAFQAGQTSRQCCGPNNSASCRQGGVERAENWFKALI